MTISVVQTASGVSPTAGMTFTDPVTAGNTIVCIVIGYSPGTTPPLSDEMCTLVSYNGAGIIGAQPLWSQLGTDMVLSASGGFDAFVSGWLIPNVAAGNTVIAQAVSGLTPNGFVAYEVAGLGVAPAIDQISYASGGSANVDSTATPAITSAPQFVVAGGGDTSTGLVAPTAGGWTVTAPATYANAGYQIASAAGGSYDWAQSGTNPGNWAAAVASIAATLAKPERRGIPETPGLPQRPGGPQRPGSPER